MANVIKKATNKFTKGLVMDFSPENTKNEVLTHALNATLLTFNGNELSLQNDMGNARVETAFLPEGYIPVGTCEYGGIIYIVSYNPLEDKSLIGCFPSPERNISRDELGLNDVILSSDLFQEFGYVESNTGKYVNDGNGNYKEWEEGDSGKRYDYCPTGNLKNVSNKVLLRDSDINPGDKFIVYADDSIYQEKFQDLEWYDGGVFKLIDNPLIKLSIVSIQDSGKIVYLTNDVVKYTKTIEDKTYKYHLLGSQVQNNSLSSADLDSYRNVLSSGYSVFKEKVSGKLALLAELIMIDSFSVTYSIQRGHTLTKKIYVPSKDENGADTYETHDVSFLEFLIVLYPEVSPEVIKDNYSIIPKLKYYHFRNESLLVQTYNGELIDLQSANLGYMLSDIINTNNEVFNLEIQRIGLRSDLELPFEEHVENEWYYGDFNSYLPDVNTGKYSEITYQSIFIPTKMIENRINLPFKYTYTVTPCMEYGKLDHLAVSNTVDFSKLFDFNASKFNVWKYRIDSNQLMLTFGAEIFDTFSMKKVTGLVLEFYDWRGFAGSLEISNKRSYSGIFTKTISLNSLQALSVNKINKNKDGYVIGTNRNINIVEDGSSHKLNGSDVEYVNEVEGWKYVTQDNSGNTLYSSLSDDNDCGTLYSNVIYGVKAYFKIKEAEKETFEKKEEFFLFTIPIYNDYYYRVSNFNNLHNPKLKMFLTYKLNDKSTINPYTNGDILNGYTTSDLATVTNYLSGKSDSDNKNLVRYFSINGTTSLNIQVGLLKDYEQFNLSCDPDINRFFNCRLNLYSDTSKDTAFNVNSTNSNINDVLLHSGVIDSSEHYLCFEGESTNFNSESGIRNYNFIDKPSSNSINIKYNFIIGYNISILDIKLQKIPTTTVCALYHKLDDLDGSYNTLDFSIRKLGDVYLSDYIYYNSGDYETYIFGVARMISTEDKPINIQCVSYNEYSESVTKESTPTKLNSGVPLLTMIRDLGKYCFLSPHTHSSPNQGGADYYNNIKPYSLDSDPIIIGNVLSTNNDTYKRPIYNSSLNTLNSILYQSEFISSMSMEGYEEGDFGYRLKYKGFTALQLSKFNELMLTTMKKVYAYNPDYESISLRLGDVYVEDYKINFTSNIICDKSEFANIDDNNKFDFHEHIQIGGISMRTYLLNLYTYSGCNIGTMDENDTTCTKWLSTLQFKPDYTYCGSENSPYLVSSLTYNTIVPQLIYDDLYILGLDIITIRHEDASYNFISGNISKSALYGWDDTSKKLIQLDVCNYSIDADGDLTLKDTQLEQKQFTIEIDKERAKLMVSNKANKTPFTVQAGIDNIQFNILDGIDATINEGDIKELDGCWVIPILSTSLLESASAIIEDTTVASKLALSPNIGILAVIGDSNNTVTMYQTDSFRMCYVVTKSLSLSPSYEKILYSQATDLLLKVGDVIRYYGLEEDITEVKYFYGLVYIPKQLKGVYTKYTNNEDFILDVINNEKTTDYFEYDSEGIYIVKNKYTNNCLRGSSITLNDLVYQPNVLGHRLFFKNGVYKPSGLELNRIFYRKSDQSKNDSRYNSLYICSGPSFTTLDVSN